jgi:hypothetical protein
VLKYNLLCYAHIKKLEEEYVDYYDYYSLYDNFYSSMESINNLNNIYSTEIFITILERLGYDDEFTAFFKYLNHIDDNDDEEDLIENFIYTFRLLNDCLFNNNCLSNALYNKMNEYINNCNIHDKNKLKCAVLRYNAYCYIFIQTCISEMNNEYDVLYNNFYNTWQDINDLSLLYTPEEILLLYDSEYESDCSEIIRIFIYFNNINEHPLKNKYKLIENNELYDCNICFDNDFSSFYKCKTCTFIICNNCYKKYNSDNCAMCRQ